MSTKLFEEILPGNLLNTIDKYLYKRKDQAFIKRWMSRISVNSLKQWEFLRRDSMNMKIEMECHELHGFNFAQFIENVIKGPTKQPIGPIFEQFCIQAIGNNPKLILNRYYVGNGGSQAFQMISTYLISRKINGSFQLQNKSIEQPLFHILLYILQNKLVNSSRLYSKFYLSLGQIHPIMTTQTVRTVDLILKHFERFYKKKIIQNSIQQNIQFRTQSLIYFYYDNEFFYGLFKIIEIKVYFQDYLKYHGYYYYDKGSKEKLHDPTYLEEVRAKAVQILGIVNQKYPFFIHCIRKQIANSLLKMKPHCCRIFQLLLTMHNFKKVLMTNEQFVFKIFSIRNKRIINMIWGDVEFRQQALKMKKQGMNLLQYVCSSYGLVHNVVILIWETGKYSVMPNIKSSKSKSIIQNRYKNGSKTNNEKGKDKDEDGDNSKMRKRDEIMEQNAHAHESA